MTPEQVANLGSRIDAGLDIIRRCVFRMGMSGGWHLAKAIGISKDPTLIEKYVSPLDESQALAYLSRLDELIDATTKQDAKCDALWTASMPGAQDRYDIEHADLCSLFEQFAFRPNAYERLVRQSDKPFLRQAKGLIEQPPDHPAVRELEEILRLRIPEFIELERRIERTLAQLDAARVELADGHSDFAIEYARSTGSGDPHTIQCALSGLRKAAEYYDYKQGYEFIEYAQHWIKRAIERRKSQ